MSTELCALRTVAAHRRALALAIAFSGFLAISFLGVRDLASTAPVDAESALSSGAVTGFVAVVYAAATAGGEIARGGLALALLAGGDRTQAIRDRLAAHAVAGATLGAGGRAHRRGAHVRPARAPAAARCPARTRSPRAPRARSPTAR